MLPKISATAYRTIGFEDAEDFVAYGQCLALKQTHRLFSKPDLPVTTLTWAIPCESLRTTPIWEGVAPFLASLQI
jgi:hypothetical protein